MRCFRLSLAAFLSASTFLFAVLLVAVTPFAPSAALAACPEGEPPNIRFLGPAEGEVVPADALVWLRPSSAYEVSIDGEDLGRHPSLPAFSPGTLAAGEHILEVFSVDDEEEALVSTGFTSDDTLTEAPALPVGEGFVVVDNAAELEPACREVFLSGCNDTVDNGRYYAAQMQTEAFFWEVTSPGGRRLVNGRCPPLLYRQEAVDEEVCLTVVALNQAGERSGATEICEVFGELERAGGCNATVASTSAPPVLSLLLLSGLSVLGVARRRWRGRTSS